MAQYHFLLPKFARYSLTDWKTLDRAKHQEILEAHLGWDVTDFNLGQFATTGLTLFTIRNQSTHNHKPYAEKIMLVNETKLRLCITIEKISMADFRKTIALGN